MANIEQDWQPTEQIRFVRRWHPVTDSAEREKRILQQRWVQHTVSKEWGHITGSKYEWRDVEIVDEPSAQPKG